MPNKPPFVHLHNHSDYSLLDGASKIKQMVETAASMGMPSLALTDHGNLFGAIQFYSTARKHKIKPIIGCEVYVAKEDRLKKTGGGDQSNHLVLLAENLTGYQNLSKLVSYGFLEGFYYKPRIDKALLSKYSDGLIALSACLKGAVPQKLIQSNSMPHWKKPSRCAIFSAREISTSNCRITILKRRNRSIPES